MIKCNELIDELAPLETKLNSVRENYGGRTYSELNRVVAAIKTYDYGKFDKYFEGFDPAATGEWSEEHIQEYYKLMEKYYANRRTYSKYMTASSPNSIAGMAVNQALASSGTSFAAGAKRNIAAAQAKQDRNAVIKGAVVGGIVAGQTGAIVGAVAAKAEVDSRNNANK